LEKKVGFLGTSKDSSYNFLMFYTPRFRAQRDFFLFYTHCF
jgi:hypothetical protein